MKPRLSLAFALLLSGFYARGQTVAISRIELAKENVIVYYDLDDSNPNNEYQINLYASKDKFSAPLVKVKGDVGPDVQPGKNRRIEWNLSEEYAQFKGKLSVEIRGKVFVPFVKLRNFDTSKKYKRGKNYDVNWRPGNTNPVHIELYKGSERVSGELNHPNSGTFSLSIGSKVKPGKDYRLKITDSKRTDDIVYSDNFRIAPKIPLVVKAIPVVAVGVGIALIIKSAAASGSEEIKNPPIID
jgi:hypothetical protein